MFEALKRLHKEYGPIFSFNIGSERSISISDYKTIKEMSFRHGRIESKG